MIRLGDIVYSNVFPVHSELIANGAGPDVELVSGIPGELNRQLASGEIDVAPCSSIEFARSGGAWWILPGLAIASRGPVESVVLIGDPPESLHGKTVSLTTASATSSALVRILLARKYGVNARFVDFDQRWGSDPFASGASAALVIGDAAFDPRYESRPRTDLGSEWYEWTQLPFVFAIWQARPNPALLSELHTLHKRLLASLAWFESRVDALAVRFAPHYGLEPEFLARYWRTLDYCLDSTLLAGMARYFDEAAKLDIVPKVDVASHFLP